MKVSVEMFQKQHPPQKRRSKLDAYYEAILELVKNGYAQNEILIFLQQNDVQVSQQYLSAYLRKQRDKQANGVISSSSQSNTDKPITATSQSEFDSQPKKNIQTEKTDTLPNKAESNFGKFDWQNRIDVSELI